MPAPSPEFGRRVLIVDPSEDSRLVLRTALQRRGVYTLDTDRAQQGLDLLRKFQPDVVVVDLDSAPDDPGPVGQAFRSEAADAGARLVLLGTVTCHSSDPAHVVPKPYHYGPLVRKIEQLAQDALHGGHSADTMRAAMRQSASGRGGQGSASANGAEHAFAVRHPGT